MGDRPCIAPGQCTNAARNVDSFLFHQYFPLDDILDRQFVVQNIELKYYFLNAYVRQNNVLKMPSEFKMAHTVWTPLISQ